MYYPMFYFDPTYIFVLVGLIICLAASAKMRSTFSKYSRVRNHWGMTGREAAEQVLAYESAGSSNKNFHFFAAFHWASSSCTYFNSRSFSLICGTSSWRVLFELYSSIDENFSLPFSKYFS